MDNYQVNEDTQEIFVIDDFGMNIMFDCSLDDMVSLDKELLKIGTFFVRKNESELDLSTHTYPLTDRFQLLEDLYDCEFSFQFTKAKLLMFYLEAYEHICDPLE